jgi:hypothetical protein
VALVLLVTVVVVVVFKQEAEGIGMLDPALECMHLILVFTLDVNRGDTAQSV